MSAAVSERTGAIAGHGVVLHPSFSRADPQPRRSDDARLAEATALAEAIGLAIDHAETLPIARARPATLFGPGQLERISQIIATLRRDDDDPTATSDPTIVFVDTALTPIQQRNLEKAWHCKVIDRTGLILEIFGARARTSEGRLQVELAALTYQRSRLVRSWTHLERQRGGFGFMGGPGESQLETDRRLITDRIARLRRELVDVKRTRSLHRQARKRVPFPIIALVGYTNTGKSTLFNRLTRSNVVARDQVFATLDPTMRRVRLPSGRVAILSDTVGFISDLPHELVDAFHATLEEVLEADVLVHVRDAEHSDSDQQRRDVCAVLAEIGLTDGLEARMIDVLNKIDLLPEPDREVLANRAKRSNEPMILLSAQTGEGCERLLSVLDERFAAGLTLIEVLLPMADGAALAWLYEHGEVVDRDDRPDGVRLRVRLGARQSAHFAQRFRHTVPDRVAP